MVKQLTGSVISRACVDNTTLEALYQLFIRYYREVDRETFYQDLAEKDWILLLKDSEDTVQGFTTMQLFDLLYKGKRIRAIFSGNTIIERNFWGDMALMKTWGTFMAQRKCEAPDIPLYWYLICSGYRTYLFLPFFFRDFYPSHVTPTPEYEKQLIDYLGLMKFPDEYKDGIVCVSNPRECLRPDLAIPPDRKLRNPHVRYFVERNPGYLLGDELVCLTEFSLENNMRLSRACLIKQMRKDSRCQSFAV